MTIRILIVLLSAALPFSTSHAEIYKWTDAQGDVHFTDKPPGNQKSQSLNIKSQPASSTETAKPSPTTTPLERQKTMLRVLEEERAAKQESDNKKDAARQQRQMECARLKDTQRRYAAGGRVYELQPNGERRYKTDEEMTRDREELAREVENCP